MRSYSSLLEVLADAMSTLVSLLSAEVLLSWAMTFPFSPGRGASTSGSLLRPCASWVSVPIAKYASCSRAHPSQKGMPWISTTARCRQAFSVLLRIWQGPAFVVDWVKRASLLLTRDLPLGPPASHT